MSIMAPQITSASVFHFVSRLFRRRSKKILKLRVTGLCEGDSPVTGEFPAQRASNEENVPIWWRQHGRRIILCHGIYRDNKDQVQTTYIYRTVSWRVNCLVPRDVNILIYLKHMTFSLMKSNRWSIYMHILLTHWGWMTHICVSKLTTIGSDYDCGLTAPNYYLNQWWNMVNWTLRNKLQWNFNRNSYIFIHENAF